MVDDGSTDHTESVIKKYPQITYLKKAHLGQADTRNAGLLLARGEYIAPLDSDDIWYENYLSESIKQIQKHQLHIFYANYKHFSKDNHWHEGLSKKTNYQNAQINIFEYKDVRKEILKDAIVPSSGTILEKLAIGSGWEPKVKIGDDTHLLLEMILKNTSCRVGFTYNLLWEKHRDTTNISDGRKGIDFRNQNIEDLKLILVKFSPLLNKHELDLLMRKIVQNQLLVFFMNLRKLKFNTKLAKEIYYQRSLLFDAFYNGLPKILHRINLRIPLEVVRVGIFNIFYK